MEYKHLSLTESSEGCCLTAYRDTGGVLTIGYGHTGGVRATPNYNARNGRSPA
jgi:GH24 family phage-related lysozyme (muramidase)